MQDVLISSTGIIVWFRTITPAGLLDLPKATRAQISSDASVLLLLEGDQVVACCPWDAVAIVQRREPDTEEPAWRSRGGRLVRLVPDDDGTFAP